jgi:DNA-binding NtrC family response regulator
MPTVLYVDGQTAMSRAVSRWLTSRGTGVCAAGTIAEAKARFDGGSFDGVFIDLWLHDGSGFELYDWILERHPGLADRVAFVTADILHPGGGTQDRFRLIDRPVLVKPFDLVELDRHVDEWRRATPEGGTGAISGARRDAAGPAADDRTA